MKGPSTKWSIPKCALLAPAAALCACGQDERSGLLGPEALSASAADHPNAPVVRLHYDYMVKSGPGGHSHAPLAASIDSIVAAFERQGIKLLIDPKHTEIPEVRATSWFGGSCTDYGADYITFEALKDRYFKPSDRRPVHYALFVHDLAEYGCDLMGGYADLGGFNFAVSTGRFFEGTPPILRTFRIEGGITMHELGHNLGLSHSGDQPHTFGKPNLLSVMNERLRSGFGIASEPGSTTVASVRIDYSDRVWPTLDERHLDERVGFGAGGNFITRFFDAAFGLRRGPSSGPVDFNGNGIIEADVAVDLNCDACFGSGALDPYGDWVYPFYSELRGFDEWAAVHRFIRTPAYVRSELRPQRALP